eukprot:5025562-Prymnesium_polylepis.1
MSVAAADIVSAGGTRPDDALCSYPSSRTRFLQHIPTPDPTDDPVQGLYRAHTDFADYYNDMLSQLKAELRATTAPAL